MKGNIETIIKHENRGQQRKNPLHKAIDFVECEEGVHEVILESNSLTFFIDVEVEVEFEGGDGYNNPNRVIWSAQWVEQGVEIFNEEGEDVSDRIEIIF